MSATNLNALPSPEHGLALLSSPLNHRLDVVFVHGLNGSRSKTWINAHNEFWPSWLGEMVPIARIWTYGYNSAVWNNPSQDALELYCARFLDLCSREGIGSNDAKVVFVGHSLGGILIKASLIQAYSAPDTSQWAALKDRVISVIFLGTPHRGSEWANRLYLSLLGPSIFWQSSSFVALLRKQNSALLATIAEKFNNIWGQKPVLTFRETKGIGFIGLIVEPQDAQTNCTEEVIIDTPFDHRRIAKALSRNELVPQAIATHLNSLQPTIGAPKPEIHAKPSPRYWPRILSRAFYKYLQQEMEQNHLQWEVIDEEFNGDLPPDASTTQKASKFLAGTFSFRFPGHESTLVIIKVPSTTDDRTAHWTIISPHSRYHPGRHEGRLVLPNEFPFRVPRIIWDSPILSAFVVRGHLSVAYGITDGWSPVLASFYVILHSLAAVVVFGSELEVTTDQAAPAPDFRCHALPFSSVIACVELNNIEEDWKMRVTNFFSRVYNHVDDDSAAETSTDGIEGQDVFRPITDFDRQVTIQAITDFMEHILQYRSLQQISSMAIFAPLLAGRDLPAVFKEVTTLRGLLRKEREWVDSLNDASSHMATQGWGRAETSKEHSQRLNF